jgi:hypothetical protein
VALIVPCHRVVREDGTLAGYRWGIERKEKLLAHESRHITDKRGSQKLSCFYFDVLSISDAASTVSSSPDALPVIAAQRCQALASVALLHNHDRSPAELESVESVSISAIAATSLRAHPAAVRQTAHDLQADRIAQRIENAGNLKSRGAG